MQIQNKIRGSLIGGAVGDALGYPVEFMRWKEIQRRYGPEGIGEYTLDAKTGTAIISDDTQMTLYTANGLLYGDTCKPGAPAECIRRAYLDWYAAQIERSSFAAGEISWLNDLPEMHAWRAPGNTCLYALQQGGTGTTSKPINNSKGCGGVMRVAPIGLYHPCRSFEERLELDRLGAEAAAITHGHPLGWLPAAMMVHIINAGLDGNTTPEAAAEEAITAIQVLFPEQAAACAVMEKLTRKAMALAKQGGEDEANIRALGEGWVGDEAFAIALYCCLRYPTDFTKAMIAAVNHSGDSDSTGAIAGNILGAWLGYEAIEEKWRRNLELHDTILELADDLCFGPQPGDPAWDCKYISCKAGTNW